MKHWATDLIGMPYARHGRGPDAYDCLGFFALVQRLHYGVILDIDTTPENLPSMLAAIHESDERRRWTPVDKPQDGDAVLMARNRVPVHIGTWVIANNTGGVLHCAEPAGVLYQTPQNLRMSGWGRISFYRRLRED